MQTKTEIPVNGQRSEAQPAKHQSKNSEKGFTTIKDEMRCSSSVRRRKTCTSLLIPVGGGDVGKWVVLKKSVSPTRYVMGHLN